MTPGFATLFERSRYSILSRRTGLSEQELTSRMEQQERFAAGILAFALHRDSRFVAHFLERICRLPPGTGLHAWEVLLEPTHWADLMLSHASSRSLVVIELKIGAPLEPHQDPSREQFSQPKSSAKGGYGWEIRAFADREKWAHSRYVTVQSNASWQEAAHKDSTVHCIPSQWNQLLRHNPAEESEMEAAVYDCLAHFGLYSFSGRHMNDAKLAQHATQPLTLLINVLSQRGIDFKARKHLEGVGPEALGISILDTDFPEIGKALTPKDGVAGWFGYELSPSAGPVLSVWFYHGNTSSNKLSVRHHVVKLLEAAGFEPVVDPCDYGVSVVCRAKDSTGDKEWFNQVLSAFGNTKTGK